MGSICWDFEPREVSFSLRLRAEFDPSVGSATVTVPWIDASGAPAAAPLSFGPLEGLEGDASRAPGCRHRPGARRVCLQHELGSLPVSLELVQALRTASLPVTVRIRDEDFQDIEVPGAARVHLAPLLLASAAASDDAGGGETQAAPPGPSTRPWPSEVSATLTDTIGLVGLYRLEVQIVTNIPILSRSMLEMLMPACFRVDDVKGLPNEAWLPESCDDMYLEVFPQLSRATASLHGVFPRTRSVDRPHGGVVRFGEPVVWFLGAASPHTVREWLQHDGVVVEVHDRDSEENLRAFGRSPAAGEDDACSPTQDSPAEAAGAEQRGSEDLGALLDRHGEVETRKPHPHGLARFPLGQLVQMKTLRLALRAEINPGRSDKKQRLMEAKSSGLRAAGIIDTAEGEEIVNQRSCVDKREFTADYHGSGAVITMQAGFAVPFPDADAIHEKEVRLKSEGWAESEQLYDQEAYPDIFAAGAPTEDGGRLTAPFRAKVALPDGATVEGPWRDDVETAAAEASAMRGVLEASEVEKEAGAQEDVASLEAQVREALAAVEAPRQRATDFRFERYGRAVLVVDESELEVVRAVLQKVMHWNAEAKGVDPNSAEVSTFQLSDGDQTDPHLDILTGFAVLDGKSRVMVFEGLRDKGLLALLEELGKGKRHTGPGFKLLSNTSVGFSHRLYADFGSLQLPQIKVRAPLEKLVKKPGLYMVGSASGTEAHEAGEAIKALVELKQATRLTALRKGSSFPKAAHLRNMQILYGGFMTDAELEARATTPASAVARTKRAATMLTTCSSAPMVAQGSQDATLKLGPLTDVTARDLPGDIRRNARRKAETDHRNADFQSTLELRKSASAPNFNTTNKQTLKLRSEEIARTNAALGKTKHRETPFLDGQEVYLYSGQKLNSAELQKKWMREHMDKEQKTASWTYNPDYLSCGFEFSGAQPPGLVRHQTDKANDTYANHEGDERAKWRNPPARPKEDFRKPAQDVSPARREELREAFIDNEWNALRLGEERAKPVAVHVRFEPDKVPHHRTITEQPFDASRMGPKPTEFGPRAGFESVHYHGRMPLEDRFAEAERHNVRERSRAAEKIRGEKHMRSFSQGATRHGVADMDRYEALLKDAPAKQLRGRLDDPLPVTMRNDEEYHECGNPAKEWHARLRENDSSPPFEPVTGTYLKRDPEVGMGKRSATSGTLGKAPWRHGARPFEETQKQGNYMSVKDFNNTKPPAPKRVNESHVWKKNSRAAITNDELRKLPYQRPADYGVAHMIV